MRRGTNDRLRILRDTFLRRNRAPSSNPQMPHPREADVQGRGTHLHDLADKHDEEAQHEQPPIIRTDRAASTKSSPEQPVQDEPDEEAKDDDLPPPQPHKIKGYISMGKNHTPTEKTKFNFLTKKSSGKLLDTNNRTVPQPPIDLNIPDDPPVNLPTPHNHKKTTPYVNSTIEKNKHNPDADPDDDEEDYENWSNDAMTSKSLPELHKTPELSLPAQGSGASFRAPKVPNKDTLPAYGKKCTELEK